MGRKRKTLPFWESAEEQGHFVRIGKSLLQHKSFRSLGTSARLLYICMTEAAAGKPEFRFSKSDYLAYGLARNTFLRAREELIAAGFIAVIECGRTTRKPNRYRFIDVWKHGQDS